MATLDPREVGHFMNQARIKLPGSSDAGIKTELYDVLKEFFKDSNSWRENISFSPVTTSQDYVLAVAENGQIIRLDGVFDDKGIPVPAFMPDFGTVHLVHPVNTDATTAWTARVVKNVVFPTDKKDIPICPDWTLRVYEDVILDGLLGRMMAQQDKSFSNPTMATYHLRRFRTGIQMARTAAIRQNNTGAQEWAYPRQTLAQGSQRGGVSTAWPTRAF